MKILITGGHLTPALALIDKLTDSGGGVDIVFVGRKYAVDSEQTLSLEYKEITKRNIRFLPLQTGRLTRMISFRSALGILRVPIGFIRAFLIVQKEHPKLIFSFGGYIALPIAISGWLMHIPVFTHEQTIAPGIANRIIAFFSQKIFYSFPDTKHLFPAAKAVFSGNHENFPAR